MLFGHPLGLHVIQFPSGKFGYVGTLPRDLACMVTPTILDIMAGRAVETPRGYLVPRFPTFDSREEAVDFAVGRGHEVAE